MNSSFSCGRERALTVAATEKVLFEEIEKIRTIGDSGRRTRKAKNQLLTNFYREMKTISGRANQLGTAEIFLGGYEKMYETPSRYERLPRPTSCEWLKSTLDRINELIATLIRR